MTFRVSSPIQNFPEFLGCWVFIGGNYKPLVVRSLQSKFERFMLVGTPPTGTHVRGQEVCVYGEFYVSVGQTPYRPGSPVATVVASKSVLGSPSHVGRSRVGVEGRNLAPPVVERALPGSGTECP